MKKQGFYLYEVLELQPFARELKAFRYEAGGGPPLSPKFPGFYARFRLRSDIDLAARLTDVLREELNPDGRLNGFRFHELLVYLKQGNDDSRIWSVRVIDTKRMSCNFPENWRYLMQLEDAILPLAEGIEPLDKSYFTRLYDPEEHEEEWRAHTGGS